MKKPRRACDWRDPWVGTGNIVLTIMRANGGLSNDWESIMTFRQEYGPKHSASQSYFSPYTISGKPGPGPRRVSRWLTRQVTRGQSPGQKVRWGFISKSVAI